MGKKKTEEAEVKPVEVVKKAEEDEEEDTPAIKALKAIDDKYCALELEFEQEVAKLRKSIFNEKQAPILAERRKVLSDTSAAPADDHEFGTPACKGFWLQAFQNADDFAEALEEHDEPVLEYLDDVQRTDLDAAVPQKGFKLDFTFKENPYFPQTSLSLEFHVNYDPDNYKPYLQPECIELKGTTIYWNEGKNVTVKMVEKKTKGGGAKKAKQKAKAAKEEPRESLFRLLFRNLKVGDPMPADLKAIMGGGGGEDDDEDDDNSEEEVKMMLDQMHMIGDCIAEQIIPYAVRFYTGEAGDKESDFDEDSEEEEDDEDDDEDSEDEPPAAKKKGGKKPAAGKPSAAGGGEKQEECKQQ